MENAKRDAAEREARRLRKQQREAESEKAKQQEEEAKQVGTGRGGIGPRGGHLPCDCAWWKGGRVDGCTAYSQLAWWGPADP